MSTISPNMLCKIKEQLNNGKSHYGQWTWSLDAIWMDNELMMDHGLTHGWLFSAVLLA